MVNTIIETVHKGTRYWLGTFSHKTNVQHSYALSSKMNNRMGSCPFVISHPLQFPTSQVRGQPSFAPETTMICVKACEPLCPAVWKTPQYKGRSERHF